MRRDACEATVGPSFVDGLRQQLSRVALPGGAFFELPGYILPMSESAAVRLLKQVGDSEERSTAVALAWFRRFAFVHVALRSFFTYSMQADSGWTGYSLVLWATILACLAGLIPKLSGLASRTVALGLAMQVLATFPLTANHLFLELVCFVPLALLDENDDNEGRLLVQALRWTTIIVLFYSGLQKVLYGRYFDGQFLAWVTANDGRFAQLFQFIIPAREFQRLLAIVPEVGAGPYRVDSVWFVVVSNGVYLFEMIAPVLMLFGRTRAAAAIAGIAFIAMIEAGAREFVFGAYMINLLLLQLRRPPIRLVFPVVVVGYLYLFAMRLGVMGVLTWPSWAPLFSHYI